MILAKRTWKYDSIKKRTKIWFFPSQGVGSAFADTGGLSMIADRSVLWCWCRCRWWWWLQWNFFIGMMMTMVYDYDDDDYGVSGTLRRKSEPKPWESHLLSSPSAVLLLLLLVIIIFCILYFIFVILLLLLLVIKIFHILYFMFIFVIDWDQSPI